MTWAPAVGAMPFKVIGPHEVARAVLAKQGLHLDAVKKVNNIHLFTYIQKKLLSVIPKGKQLELSPTNLHVTCGVLQTRQSNTREDATTHWTLKHC